MEVEVEEGGGGVTHGGEGDDVEVGRGPEGGLAPPGHQHHQVPREGRHQPLLPPAF